MPDDRDLFNDPTTVPDLVYKYVRCAPLYIILNAGTAPPSACTYNAYKSLELITTPSIPHLVYFKAQATRGRGVGFERKHPRYHIMLYY